MRKRVKLSSKYYIDKPEFRTPWWLYVLGYGIGAGVIFMFLWSTTAP